jgi:hypothetical protein
MEGVEPQWDAAKGPAESPPEAAPSSAKAESGPRAHVVAGGGAAPGAPDTSGGGGGAAADGAMDIDATVDGDDGGGEGGGDANAGGPPVYVSHREVRRPFSKGGLKKAAYFLNFYLVDRKGRETLAATGSDQGKGRGRILDRHLILVCPKLSCWPSKFFWTFF